MSLHEYKTAERLHRSGEPFYALIMAAMRQADFANLARLRDAFPETFAELNARYHSGGGVLPGEPDYENVQRGRALLGLPRTDGSAAPTADAQADA